MTSLILPSHDGGTREYRLQGATVVAGREHRFGLLSAARGVQLAELGLQSNDERRTIDIPEITLS